MKRRLFTILSALSLLLCGWFSFLGIVKPWKKGLLITFSASTPAPPIEAGIDGYTFEWNRAPSYPAIVHVRADRHWRLAGFVFVDGVAAFGVPRWNASSFTSTPNYRLLVVPHWFPIVAASALPILHVARQNRERHAARLRAQGRCPSCGYDLRATPGRCPECGLVPAAPPPVNVPGPRSSAAAG